MKANCWFVTNTPFRLALPENTEYLPEIIRAEEILNFLWLSNPSVTAFINSSELSSLGLTRLVSTTISYSLPSPKVLRDLDNNFNAYGGTTITADDTIMVAAMIAKKRIDRPEELNKIALQSPDNFISKVKDFADQGRREEKEIQEKLQKILERLDIAFKRQEEERKQSAIEVPIATTAMEQLKPDAEKQALQISNQRLRAGLIAAAIIISSMIWWAFDHFFSVPLLSQQLNYYLLKVVGQLLLITLTSALYFKTYRAAWITTTVALTICFIMLCKRDTKQDKQEPAKQEINQPQK